jgi:transcriptional regulator with PAS, ATPase and Fis domain
LRSIRSLLWVGAGEAFARCGVDEAPTLDVTWVRDVDEAYALPPLPFDAAVLEGRDPESLVGAMRRLALKPQCPPILVCLFDGRAESIRRLVVAGAQEVIVPGDDEDAPRLLDELLDRVDQLAAARRGQSAWVADRIDESQLDTDSETVGRSRAIRNVYGLVERAARTTATVLVQGETGTGKELIAQRIHARSPRARHPFVAVNCAAFPETLLESELFGHRRGAFTGAERDKAGHFELAHRGTLFLDEIGETSAALQAKLLRVLQEREVLPVGATRPHPIDVRVIAATNRSLQSEVEAGRFREDLYYRLAVFPIAIPPLRERADDILSLARHFVARHGERDGKAGCRISVAAQRLLLTHRWPGNVRELENEMQRALALAEPGETITPKLLSPRVLGIMEAIDRAAGAGDTLKDALDRVEAWLIRRALEMHGGRKAVTARKLGVTREGLYKKMKRLGIG